MTIKKNKVYRFLVFSAVFFSLSIAGCSSSKDKGQMLEAALTPNDNLITNSVNKSNALNGVDDEDARIVKDSVVSTNPNHIEMPITWQNPDSEATGKIVSIKHFTGRHGQKCKSFRTTVNNYQGSSYYDGETCQVDGQDWALTWFKPFSG